MFDVVVIGAGIAGLTCARLLHQAGYSVMVADKSRGLGGRSATRRLHGTRADHGLRYLEVRGELSGRLVDVMASRYLIQPWTDDTYVAPEGMNAVGKFLADNLDILLDQRVEAIALTPEQTWQVTGTNRMLTTQAIVVAIPAPQALMLIAPLADIISSEFIASLRSVEFDPCITVMAGYPVSRLADVKQLDWKQHIFTDADLAWIGLDSSKRLDSTQPVFVLHSSAAFARKYLEAQDLQPAADYLLNQAAEDLIPWLNSPAFWQVHRWRYAFGKHSLSLNCLAATPLNLVCCGDWCGGNLVESALQSGLAAATHINSQLRQLPLPEYPF